MDSNAQIREVASIVQRAGRMLVITGAGVSAESGIPTFRGVAAAFPDGRTEEGVLFEEVLSRQTFVTNPALSWKYFFLLEKCMRDKHPNAAHLALAGLQTPQRSIWVATQNIDGLHQAAGSSQVLELHGNLRRIVCTTCDHLETRVTFEGLAPRPVCPKCDGLLRPDIVLYQESLPTEPLEALYRESDLGFDIVFSIGTTSLFQYVVEPVLLASHAGTPIVEINPNQTSISELADYRFPDSAGNILREIHQACSGTIL